VPEANKTVVRRLVDEVFNGGHLEVIDELYAPELARAGKRWIVPFRASLPDVHMEIVELIAEGEGRRPVHLLGHPPGSMARPSPHGASVRAGR
jgi:hypothetical protein